MDRVQRSGLIALAVLLLTALGAHYVGSLPGSDATIPPRLAAQNPATLEGVKFLPPEQRKFFVGPADFVRPPVRNPMLGLNAANINAGNDFGPESASAEQQTEGGAIAEKDPPGRHGVGTKVPIPDIDEPPQPIGDEPRRTDARYIRVQENDNLTRIAKRELGDADRWKEIADLNKLEAPYRVRFGQRIQLPAATSIKAADTSGSDSGELEKLPKQGSLYKVAQNETAMHISQRFYNTSKHWQLILDYNGIKDARDLRAGQTIRIPPQP
ncbi:MAG: LysM peptidoglycan-binding domain-containing protein [Planctomycetes bacterium]|nr:LysM peptidoglycan-binding domain-containing protein [Planctomycetota bacterium]